MKHIIWGFILFITACSKDPKTTQTKGNSITYNKPITFDFRHLKKDQVRDIPGMRSISPSGDTINVNSSYLTMNGEPWIPTYAEFNYQRYPERFWEDALLKLKSQGLQGVSSYIFWIGHEETEGVWNFKGNKNLRKFIKLCQKHNLLFFARIGPWVNGEIKGGGHPDWLIEKLGSKKNPHGYGGSGGDLRSMSPDYLKAVDKFYKKIAEQMKGLYWKDGGPIFAIQLDNEYTPVHSGIGGTKLIEWEKETALKYGMIVPLYTTTGWNKAEFIQDHTIQVHGSYAAYYWAKADDFFRTPAFSFSTLRAVDGIDTEVNHFDSKSTTDIEKYIANPYLTCETGIGMHSAYHRRSLVNAKDNGAVSLVELGSGCNGMGYFMGIGGSTPTTKKGKYLNRDFSQTSIETPIFSNDYQSAIGEFGQVRESFHEYPIQLHFMKDFGKFLAPYRTYISPETDELRGADITISKELQRAVRTDGKSGFIFVNNHIKNDTLYRFNNVQFNLKLKNENLLIPSSSIDIPRHSYLIWPFNLNLSGVNIKYATAQPILHLKKSNTYVFFQNDRIKAEFSFENEMIEDLHVNKGAILEKNNQTTKVLITNAGLDCCITIEKKDKQHIRLLVLNEKQAKQMYRHNDCLFLSNAEVLVFKQDKLQLISEKTENAVWVYPSSSIKNIKTKQAGLFEYFSVNFDKITVPIISKEIQNGKTVTFKNRIYGNSSNGNIGVPNDSIFNKGTIISLNYPQEMKANLYDIRTIVDYKAAAVRFYKNNRFIYDDYYNGDQWEISYQFLFNNYESNMDLKLKFIPLQPQDKVRVGDIYWPNLELNENVLEVKNIKAKAVYSKTIELN